ncbi:hypothetical protein DKK70_10125 [Gilliamella apicola]|uniref:Uncharacterized protein n=1 Tax=Gilliamella apicola TaxID=1196095 RepID=A0A2V4E7C9_9GAMM|nr:hypothetical protein DKK70_10125 [Gilliamella apicola]
MAENIEDHIIRFRYCHYRNWGHGSTYEKNKIPDKVKNLELLSKHVSVQVFKEKTETTVNM